MPKRRRTIYSQGTGIEPRILAWQAAALSIILQPLCCARPKDDFFKSQRFESRPKVVQLWNRIAKIIIFSTDPKFFSRSKPEFFGIGRFYLDLERTHFVIFKGIMAAPRLMLLRHFAEMPSRYRNERCCLHKEEFSKKNLSLM